MSSLERDKHLICPSCVGHICELSVRCDECKEWPDEFMKSYVKHQESLRHKRESKLRAKGRKLGNQSNDSAGDGSQSGVDETGSVALSSISRQEVDLDEVVASINASVENKFKDLTSSFSQDIDSKFSALMSKFNMFLSSSPLVSGSGSGVRTRADPNEELQTGQAQGGNQEGRRLEGTNPTNSPARHEQDRAKAPGLQGVGPCPQRVPDNDPGEGTSGLGNSNSNRRLGTDDDTDSDEETPPAEFNPSAVEFRQIFDLITAFHPEATKEVPQAPQAKCITEGVFAPSSSSSSKQPLRFTLFDKFQKNQTLVEQKVAKVANSSSVSKKRKKNIISLLTHDKGAYEFSGDPEEFAPPEPNRSLTRLTSKPVSENMSVSVSLEDISKIERLCKSMVESHSFAMWIFGGMLGYIKSSGFVPPDINLFERMCTSFTSAQVRTNNLNTNLSGYLVALRRSLYLAHMPPSVNVDQRARLASSSPFTRSLFDQEVLENVIKEHQGDVAATSNRDVAKVLSSVLPSLVSKKRKFNDGEASSSSGGMAAVGSPLTGPRSSASEGSAPKFGRFVSGKRGRARFVRGGGGGKGKGDATKSGDPKKGFQT